MPDSPTLDAGNGGAGASPIQHVQPVPLDATLARILPTPPTAESATGASIDALGFVSVPLLVRLSGTDARAWEPDGGGQRRVFDFEVVDGERRVADLRATGATHVHALTLPAETSPATVAALRLALNLARKSNPYREAEAVERLGASGMSDADVASLLGVTRPTISKRRKLLTLGPVLLAGLRDGKIGPSVAYRLAGLGDDAHADAVRVLTNTGRFTGDDLRAITRAVREESVASLPADLFDMPAGYDPDASTRTDAPPVAGAGSGSGFSGFDLSDEDRDDLEAAAAVLDRRKNAASLRRAALIRRLAGL